MTRREFLKRAVSGAAAVATVPQLVFSADTSLEELYQGALARFRTTKWLRSSDFLPMVEKYPNSAQAHLLMGNVYSVSSLTPNNYQRAIEEFTNAIALNPNLTATYMGRGNSWLHKEEKRLMRALPESALPERMPEECRKALENAVLDYDKAIKLEPKLFSAYFNKGVALKQLGREKEAIEFFDRAIKIGLKVTPYKLTVEGEDKTQYFGGAQPIYGMSSFFRHIIERAMSEEIDGQRVIQLSTMLTFISNVNDPVAFAHYHKGVSYARANMKQYRSAIKSLTKAIELNPDVPEFYSKRALAYIGANEGDKMYEDMNKKMEVIGKIQALVTKRDSLRKN